MSTAQRIGRAPGLSARRRRKREVAGLPEQALAVAAGTGAGLLAVASATSSRFLVALAFGALAVPVAATLLGGLRRLLLAAVILDIQLQLDINPGYRDPVAQLGALSGWTLSLTTVSLVALYLLWAARLLVGPRDAAWLPRLRVAAVPAAFVAVTALSLLVAQDRTLGGFEINLLVQVLALFVYLASTVRHRDDVAFIVAVLLVGLCLQSLLGVAALVTGVDVTVGRQVSQAIAAHSSTRLMGTFSGPNDAGDFFAVMLPLAVAVAMSPLGAAWRRLSLCACALGVVGLGLTLSRGAWIGFAVALAVLVAGARGTGRRILSTRALVGIGVAMAVVLVPLWGEISARLTGPDGGSAESRRPLYALAWRMIVDHPLTGVGANNFVAALPHYAGPAFTGDWLYVVHDRYLLIWSQSGLGALILFLVFLATTIRRGWRARLSEDALLSAAGLGLAAGVVSMAVHMHVDILNSRAANQTLFLAAGVLAAPVMAQAARRRAGVGRGR